MKKASVTTAKNNLSAILKEVQNGEAFLILDRGRPVARLEPLSAEERSGDPRLADLARRGLLRRGSGKVNRQLIDEAPPALPRKVSALALLLQEREEGR